MPKAIRWPRALVVDDHPAAEAFARMLGAMGCEAKFVTNPYMAVDAVNRIEPEVIFLDLGMPGINGYQLARILRAKHGWDRLKIVAVTGHGSGGAGRLPARGDLTRSHPRR